MAYRALWKADSQANPVAGIDKEKSYAKNRLQPAESATTIDIAFTDENTTWFDDTDNSAEVSKITDFEGGLVISDSGYSYPVLIYDVSRADINHSRLKALKLLQTYTQP